MVWNQRILVENQALWASSRNERNSRNLIIFRHPSGIEKNHKLDIFHRNNFFSQIRQKPSVVSKSEKHPASRFLGIMTTNSGSFHSNAGFPTGSSPTRVWICGVQPWEPRRLGRYRGRATRHSGHRPRSHAKAQEELRSRPTALSGRGAEEATEEWYKSVASDPRLRRYEPPSEGQVNRLLWASSGGGGSVWV